MKSGKTVICLAIFLLLSLSPLVLAESDGQEEQPAQPLEIIGYSKLTFLGPLSSDSIINLSLIHI